MAVSDIATRDAGRAHGGGWTYPGGVGAGEAMVMAASAAVVLLQRRGRRWSGRHRRGVAEFSGGVLVGVQQLHEARFLPDAAVEGHNGGMPSRTLYDDGGLVLDDDGMTIRRYYFPWAGAKRIRYRDVRRVEVRPMRWLSGKGRGWGTSDLGYWLPLDLRRSHKDTVLVLHLGRHVKPAVSPNDPDRVLALLRGRVAIE